MACMMPPGPRGARRCYSMSTVCPSTTTPRPTWPHTSFISRCFLPCLPPGLARTLPPPRHLPLDLTLSSDLTRCSWLMHRPIGSYRHSEHSKSLTSFNMARHLLHVYFRLQTAHCMCGINQGLELGLVVAAAACRPLVLRMPFPVLNADSGR